MKTLTADGYPIGVCSDEDYGLAVEYLRDGMRPVQVVKLLRQSGVDMAIQIVVQAARELGIDISATMGTVRA